MVGARRGEHTVESAALPFDEPPGGRLRRPAVGEVDDLVRCRRRRPPVEDQRTAATTAAPSPEAPPETSTVPGPPGDAPLAAASCAVDATAEPATAEPAAGVSMAGVSMVDVPKVVSGAATAYRLSDHLCGGTAFEIGQDDCLPLPGRDDGGLRQVGDRVVTALREHVRA